MPSPNDICHSSFCLSPGVYLFPFCRCGLVAEVYWKYYNFIDSVISVRCRRMWDLPPPPRHVWSLVNILFQAYRLLPYSVSAMALCGAGVSIHLEVVTSIRQSSTESKAFLFSHMMVIYVWMAFLPQCFCVPDNPVNFLLAERMTHLASVLAGYIALPLTFIFRYADSMPFWVFIAGFDPIYC